VISVRGHGKFRLLTLGGTTKKGRIRLTAEQYI
jgi:RNA-binding protein YlmH